MVEAPGVGGAANNAQQQAEAIVSHKIPCRNTTLRNEQFAKEHRKVAHAGVYRKNCPANNNKEECVNMGPDFALCKRFVQP